MHDTVLYLKIGFRASSYLSHPFLKKLRARVYSSEGSYSREDRMRAFSIPDIIKEKVYI